MSLQDGPTPSQVQQAQSNISNLMDWVNHLHNYEQDVIDEVYDQLTVSSAHDPGQEFITAMMQGTLKSIGALPFPGAGAIAGFSSAFFSVYSKTTPPSLKAQFASVWARFNATFLQANQDLADIYADVAGHWNDIYTDPSGKKYTISQMGTGVISIPANTSPEYQTMTDTAVAAYRVSLAKSQIGGKWKILVDTCGVNFPNWDDTDAKNWTPGFVKSNPAFWVRWSHIPSACCAPQSEQVYEDFLGQSVPNMFDFGGPAPASLMTWLCKTDQFGNVTNENGLITREELFNGWGGALEKVGFCIPTPSPPVAVADPSQQDIRDAKQWHKLFKKKNRKKLEWQLINRAYSDGNFYRALMKNPRDAVAGHLGVPFPPGASIEIICEKPAEYKLVLPLAGVDFTKLQNKKKGLWARFIGWFRK